MGMDTKQQLDQKQHGFCQDFCKIQERNSYPESTYAKQTCFLGRTRVTGQQRFCQDFAKVDRSKYIEQLFVIPERADNSRAVTEGDFWPKYPAFSYQDFKIDEKNNSARAKCVQQAANKTLLRHACYTAETNSKSTKISSAKPISNCQRFNRTQHETPCKFSGSDSHRSDTL